MIEKFRWLAGLIAAHPDRKLMGRTRLQKEVKLLQRLGFPTDYTYTIFFYGPYSEEVQSDIRLLEHFELVKEVRHESNSGRPFYEFEAYEEAVLTEIKEYQPFINILAKSKSEILELAATYDAFRQLDMNHDEALVALRRKKGEKCGKGNEKAALDLLNELGLPSK